MASVKVAVRVRPFNKREENLNSKLVTSVQGNQVLLDPPTPLSSATPEQPRPSHNATTESVLPGDRSRQQKFTFDYSYWSHNKQDHHFAGQDRVFHDLGSGVVENAFNGYNVCVFAYGQTGSGKTYTMMGNDNTEDELGLIPRICKSLFSKMAASAASTEDSTSFRTEASYLEIYNERVKDLLGPSNADHHLKVREHPKDGPYVENLSKHLVMDYGEIKSLMERGNAVRTTAATNMNDTSSRSHAIFTVTFVKAGFIDGLPTETVSKIHLVDLAGSERANASGATGQRLKEGGHINKSLVTLGSVISALAEASKNQNANSGKRVFIPYRDSVLTWLLKDSLGGNSKTIMIATISPAEVNHGETLSTLRYANRAKNIINKPTINEDPNVKLIRELRNEIERLRSGLSLNEIEPSKARQKLAAKEAQERHLTEEWTEKWKEAAKILDEHQALALKQTGLGVSLDSDKPHLVGIDEDLLSTGITLYHLKDGDTTIGSEEENDIILKGIHMQPQHCIITLKDGIATLLPQPEAMCKINAEQCKEATRLYQGCVIVLGKTNMFRYNDPTEAANMRMNLSQNQAQHFLGNQSLLSQSLSDLRSSPLSAKSSTPLKKRSVEICNFNNNCDEELIEESSGDRISRIASPDSLATMTPTSSQGSSEENSVEMTKMYEAISEQKNVIMKCLDSDQCDINALNEQLEILQAMQEKYSKLEFEQARNLWMAGVRHLGEATSEAEYETQFSMLVEQEVEKRLFQEKVLKAESEFQERELQKMERERELAVLKRQHEREIYMLKRKLHESAITPKSPLRSPTSTVDNPDMVRIAIPTFILSGVGSTSHVEYQVVIYTLDAQWTVMRRFRQFRDLHMAMTNVYGPLITALPFPSRRIFGNKSESVSGERQKQLTTYMNCLMLTLAKIESCPLFGQPHKKSVQKLSGFFHESAEEVTEEAKELE